MGFGAFLFDQRVNMGIRLYGVGLIDRRVVIIDSPTILDQLIKSITPTSSKAKIMKLFMSCLAFWRSTR